MKVLSFLEFFGLTPQEKRDYLDSIGLISKNDYKDRWSCDDSELFFSDVYYKEVYIEFKPELITELFEGWEVRNGASIIWEAKDTTDALLFDDSLRCGIYIIRGALQEKLFRYQSTTPRTLDDFIRDCERAGIELTWSQQ